MNKDRVEGKVKDVAGRVERQAGEWTEAIQRNRLKVQQNRSKANCRTRSAR